MLRQQAMHYEGKMRYLYWEFDCIFFIPKRGHRYSHTNSYNFAMTLISQGDDITAEAWAACEG